MKKKFIVTIEETVSNDFEILAENVEKAKRIAEEKYKSGELILEPGNILSAQLKVENTDYDNCTEWIEI